MNLKTLRELRGLSRKELSAVTGISFRSIQDYEQGHKDLVSAKGETLRKLSKALNCSIEDLISIDGQSGTDASAAAASSYPGSVPAAGIPAHTGNLAGGASAYMGNGFAAGAPAHTGNLANGASAYTGNGFAAEAPAHTGNLANGTSAYAGNGFAAEAPAHTGNLANGASAYTGSASAAGISTYTGKAPAPEAPSFTGDTPAAGASAHTGNASSVGSPALTGMAAAMDVSVASVASGASAFSGDLLEIREAGKAGSASGDVLGEKNGIASAADDPNISGQAYMDSHSDSSASLDWGSSPVSDDSEPIGGDGSRKPGRNSETTGKADREPDHSPSSVGKGGSDTPPNDGVEARGVMYRIKPEDRLLYFLMHKNEKVAALFFEPVAGNVISVVELFSKELLPVSVRRADPDLKAWWYRRAVPITQGKIKSILAELGFLTPQAFLLRCMGLSMEDCYWVCPANAGFYWRDVSLFRNDFEDIVGAMHFGGLSASLDLRKFDIRLPSASAGGNVPKAWICVDNGRRYLIKGTVKGNTQQIFNEVAASYMHRKQGRFPYVSYQFYTIEYGKQRQFGASSEAFTSETLEFIPAMDLIFSAGGREGSDYEKFVDAAVGGGLYRDEVIAFLDYQILMDFVITNVDRNLYNFGVLRNADSLQYESIAPIFDSGNSMFHDLDLSKGTLELKNIPVRSFAENEVGLLRMVTNPDIIDMNKLMTDEEMAQILQSSSRTSEEVKLLVTIYKRKKELLQKLQRGDTRWML